MAAERTPFASIEGALEYVGLLRKAIATAKREVLKASASAQAQRVERQLDALRLVRYKLERLDAHMRTSHVLLNDLRTLRRLLAGERASGGDRPAEPPGEPVSGRLKTLRRMPIP